MLMKFVCKVPPHPPPPPSATYFFSKKSNPPAVIRTPPSHLLIFGFLSLAPKKFEQCKRMYFSMKFCLLVTVALDIFIKEKNNTLYFPCISSLSLFMQKVSTRSN